MTTTTEKLNFVCPKCSAVNRVPRNRLDDGPICASCKSALVPKNPIELTDANFEKFITRSDVTVVVDFWASWCAPCQAMAPSFAAAANELAPEVLLAKVDTESNQVAGRFKIAGIPCLIAFKFGKEVARQAGVMTEEQIVKWSLLAASR